MKRIVLFSLFCFIAAMVAAGKYVVTANSLNVRKYADSNAEVLFKITKGQEVTVKEFNGAWAFIDVPKGCGWVAKKYLKSASSSSTTAVTTKKLKKHRTTENVMDEPVNKAMTWIIRISAGLGLLVFFAFLVPAIKREKTWPHVVGLGLCVLLLAYASFAEHSLTRFIAPAAIITVLMWPLLYTKLSESAVTIITWVLMIAGLVALYFMLRVEFVGSFWVWLWTFVAACIDWGILGATVFTQNQDKCPHCNYYANHTVIYSDYQDSSISSETSSHDSYSHSVTRGNVTTNYYTRHYNTKFYRNDKYLDTYQCSKCFNTFKRTRTERRLIGSASS